MLGQPGECLATNGASMAGQWAGSALVHGTDIPSTVSLQAYSLTCNCGLCPDGRCMCLCNDDRSACNCVCVVRDCCTCLGLLALLPTCPVLPLTCSTARCCSLPGQLRGAPMAARAASAARARMVLARSGSSSQATLSGRSFAPKVRALRAASGGARASMQRATSLPHCLCWPCHACRRRVPPQQGVPAVWLQHIGCTRPWLLQGEGARAMHV